MENWYHRPQLFILGTRANSWAIQHPENSRCDSQPCVRCRAFSADWNIICLSSPTPMLYCNSCPTVLLWCSEWSERWQQLLGPLWNSWTEPSIRRVSSSRVGLVVGKEPNPRTTHPVADLALKVAGGYLVDQICADPVWPPTPECVVLRTLLQLTCMWNANQFCPSRVFPVQRVWCHTESMWSLDYEITDWLNGWSSHYAVRWYISVPDVAHKP